MPATVDVDTAISGGERCVSCHAPLSGPYCSCCGEQALEPDALTLRHFLVHTVVHELLNVDGALLRTLRLLFVRPGQLSLEYAAGRRRPYLNPFRLLLIAIVVYALITASGLNVFWRLGPVVMNMAPTTVRRNLPVADTVEQIDQYGLLRAQLDAKRERVLTDTARARFHDRLAAFAQPVSFANVLLLAAALHLCFRSTRRRFLEHSAFSMHVVSFVMLSSVTMLAAIRLRAWMGGMLFLVLGLLSLWQFVYLTLAIRRFYLPGSGWGGRVLSVVTAMLMYVLNTAFMTAVQVAGAAIALALA